VKYCFTKSSDMVSPLDNPKGRAAGGGPLPSDLGLSIVFTR
jgi:hypothetical protein